MLTKIDSAFRIDENKLTKTFNRMIKFQSVCRVRLIVLNFAINYFNFESEIEKLKRIYQYLDEGNLACLNLREIYKLGRRVMNDLDV